MVKLGYTILYVADVTKAIEFYEAAFGFQRKFISPGNEYGELLTGETTLSFATVELAHSNLSNGFQESKPTNPAFGIEIGLVTEHVQEVLDKAVQCGAQILEPAKLKPWGQTVAYIRDLDGFLIEVCTPMG